MSTNPKPTIIAEPKRKSPDVWARASSLARRLARLDDAEQQEIAQSPTAIRAKFEARREKAMAEAEPEVAEIVKRMRGGEAAP